MKAPATVAVAAPRLDTATLGQIFLEARTHNRWQPQPVDDGVLGYGDPAGLFPRNPRLAFEDACRIV